MKLMAFSSTIAHLYTSSLACSRSSLQPQFRIRLLIGTGSAQGMQSIQCHEKGPILAKQPECRAFVTLENGRLLYQYSRCGCRVFPS
ncbi:hypothetical protein BGX38DRAFT_1176891 [Terfezia claveryi]|nr:hypothetical protein BGX38DRAFT_1176891 [Terfezia claveryi]